MQKSSKKSNNKLWKSIVKEVKQSNKGGKKGQWSARKAQLAVKKYKSRGGTYIGKKSKKNSLTKWTKQDWRTKSGKNSVVGPKATGERYLPAKAIKKLSSKEYKRTSRLKRKSIKKGKQYSKQPKNISKKIKKFRSFGKVKKEKLKSIIVSPNKNKKYRAEIYDPQTKRTRHIDFGARDYEQYKDSTKLKKYSFKNHGDKKRRDNYFSRHSGIKNKKEAIAKEWRKSNGKYNAKILSHQYLW